MSKIKKFLYSYFVIVTIFWIINTEVQADAMDAYVINNYSLGYYLAIFFATILVVGVSIIVLVRLGKNNPDSNNQKDNEENRKDGSI